MLFIRLLTRRIDETFPSDHAFSWKYIQEGWLNNFYTWAQFYPVIHLKEETQWKMSKTFCSKCTVNHAALRTEHEFQHYLQQHSFSASWQNAESTLVSKLFHVCRFESRRLVWSLFAPVPLATGLKNAQAAWSLRFVQFTRSKSRSHIRSCQQTRLLELSESFYIHLKKSWFICITNGRPSMYGPSSETGFAFADDLIKCGATFPLQFATTPSIRWIVILLYCLHL